jgi:hypothetical protein
MSGQDESAGFKVVHAILAFVSIGFAVAIAKIGLDARRRSAAAQQVPRPESVKVEPSTGMNLKS